MKKHRTLMGTVLSNKMQKTVVVQVERLTRDPVVQKVVRRREKYKAHDEKSECQMGDQVLLVESRPLSREKRWRVQSVLRKGGMAAPVSAKGGPASGGEGNRGGDASPY